MKIRSILIVSIFMLGLLSAAGCVSLTSPGEIVADISGMWTNVNETRWTEGIGFVSTVITSEFKTLNINKIDDRFFTGTYPGGNPMYAAVYNKAGDLYFCYYPEDSSTAMGYGKIVSDSQIDEAWVTRLNNGQISAETHVRTKDNADPVYTDYPDLTGRWMVDTYRAIAHKQSVAGTALPRWKEDALVITGMHNGVFAGTWGYTSAGGKNVTVQICGAVYDVSDDGSSTAIVMADNGENMILRYAAGQLTLWLVTGDVNNGYSYYVHMVREDVPTLLQSPADATELTGSVWTWTETVVPPWIKALMKTRLADETNTLLISSTDGPLFSGRYDSVTATCFDGLTGTDGSTFTSLLRIGNQVFFGNGWIEQDVMHLFAAGYDTEAASYLQYEKIYWRE